jgi:hypothetical protein
VVLTVDEQAVPTEREGSIDCRSGQLKRTGHRVRIWCGIVIGNYIGWVFDLEITDSGPIQMRESSPDRVGHRVIDRLVRK